MTALTLVVSLAAALEGRAPTAKERFESARQQEADVRGAVEQVSAGADTEAVDRVVRPARRVVAAYEIVVRRFPTSGYSDNALLQAASLSQWLYARFGRAADRVAATKYYDWLQREYPASPLRAQARAAVRSLDTLAVAASAPVAPAAAPVRPPARPGPSLAARTAAPTAAAAPPPTATAVPAAAAAPLAPARATLRAIDRVVLDETVRITLALDKEAPFSHEVIDGPPRAFVDLFGAVAAEALQDTALRYEADAVRQVRVGRRQGAVRVVLDLESATKVSVFTLYNPYRVVIDAARGPGARQGAVVAVTQATVASPLVMPTDETRLPDEPATAAAAPATLSATPQVLGAVPPPADETELPDRSARAAEPADPAPPGAPSRNADGTFSLARQLGLGISRIVIDPGHGGHDPGTPTAGTNEARLVLDVALRLEKLLVKDGFDVVLTRRTDVFIPLEERTAIANRERADLFLSIHANSGRDPKARGVEVYYLSFASNPEAEAVAARENTTSTGGMHNLPGIVRAIALNNKLDESRDFAQMVQQSLASRLSKTNEGMRSRGVKKAPFVVLIGAAMPSVLAEIGFITNRQEVGLIKTPAYRQKVAESLQAAVVQYQRSLKRQMSVATR